MFRPDPSLTHIAATRDQVVSIIESINHPHVGVPGHSTQPTEGTLVGIRNPGGTFSIFVHLFLVHSKAAVIYTYDGGPFDIETYPDVESEALEFVESMGFMVDNLNFRNLAPPQQQEMMARLSCFHPITDTGKGEGDAGEDLVELEEVGEISSGWGDEAYTPERSDTEPLDEVEELEEIEELEELDEIEPVAARSWDAPAAGEPVEEELRRRVGRLLASF